VKFFYLSVFVHYAEKNLDTSADWLPLEDLPEDILVQYVVWLHSKCANKKSGNK